MSKKLEIGIFKRKKGNYNKLVLQTLYNNGPLTAWELARKIYEPRKSPSKYAKEIEFYSLRSLHPTINRRLRALEAQQYVRKGPRRKWLFLFKGVIANLLMQSTPKPWNEKWNAGVEGILKILEIPKLQQFKEPIKYEGEDLKLQISVKTIKRSYEKLYNNLKDFQKWVDLTNTVKELMEKGVINLDVISNRTLITLLIYQDEDFLELSEAKLFREYF